LAAAATAAAKSDPSASTTAYSKSLDLQVAQAKIYVANNSTNY